MTKNDAFPTFGTSYVNEPALRAVHADGNTSTELAYVSHTTEQEADGVQYTEITLRDTYFPFDVVLCFNAYQKENVIEAWTVISHNEKKPVMLYNYASSHLFFSEPTYYLTQFYGEWADEMKMKEMQLTRGKKVLESKLGVRSNQHAHACFLLGLDAPAQENSGRVLGGTLAWPGSWNLTFDVDNLDNLHVICGINSFAGQAPNAMEPPFELFLAAAIVVVLAAIPLIWVYKDSTRLRNELQQRGAAEAEIPSQPEDAETSPEDSANGEE